MSERIYKGRRTPKLYQGKTIYQWMSATGLPYSTLQQRVQRGVSLDAPKSNRGRPSFASAKGNEHG
jgi:hypothetical protein